MQRTGFVTAFLVWLASASPALVAQPIEITPTDVRTAARGPQTAYTGVAIAELLFRANEKSNLTMAEISFEPGSRTTWHNHPAGHGANATQGLRHIAVWEFVDGSGGELQEHVTDAEYLAEPADE